jgi:cytidine deaminase
MVAAGESEIEEICIVAGTTQPVSPCGGCRQKISEFSKPDTPVILANPDGDTVRKTAGELLPDSFKPSHLKE